VSYYVSIDDAVRYGFDGGDVVNLKINVIRMEVRNERPARTLTKV
jgi:hypothetical protein